MIDAIEGNIIRKSVTELIIDIGGLHLKLFKPFSLDSDIPSKGKTKIFTQLCISENDIKIFGFGNQPQRDLFNLLISVNGVGPFRSLKIVSEIKPDQFAKLIKQKDIVYLKSIKGIGDKLSERIYIELKDKVDDLITEDVSDLKVEVKLNKDAITALMNLGLSKKESEEAVSKAIHEAGSSATLEDIIKIALKKI